MKLMLLLEKVVRDKLRKRVSVADALQAFIVLGSEHWRKHYDLKLKYPKSNYRGGRLLSRVGVKVEELIHAADLELVFSEAYFIKSSFTIVVLRSLGLDFLVYRIGYEDSNPARRMLFSVRLAFTAFLSHTLIYYGFPIILGLIERKFFLALIPIFLIKCFREYRRVKVEYYAREVGLKN